MTGKVSTIHSGVNLDKPNDYGATARHLPRKVVVLHGCQHCEWKDSKMCPFGFKSGPGHALRKNMHTNGICEDRRQWLLSFAPWEGGEKFPTVANYTVWKESFDAAMGEVQMHHDYHKLKEIEYEIKKLIDERNGLSVAEGDVTNKEYNNKLKALYRSERRARTRWERMWNNLRHYNQKTLDREMPKKLEVTHKQSMRIEDVHSLMRDTVIEVDAKEVKGNGNDND